jgi:CheY-like chemotaxis protein
MPRPEFSRWRSRRVRGIPNRQIVLNSPPSFVIVDDIDDNRFLLSKALLRSFPSSSIIECLDSSTALAAVQCDQPTAIIVHRSLDLSGPAIIRALREVTSAIPIVMVSGRESCPEAIAAGANAFLNYDAWLRIGTVITEVLSPRYVQALTGAPFKQADPLGWRPGAYRTSSQ